MTAQIRSRRLPSLVFLVVVSPSFAPRAHAQTPPPPAEVAATLVGPPAPGGLTADEVARRAAATSFDVRARAEETAAAAAALEQARAAFVPRLSGLARYTRLSAIDQPSLGTLVASPGAPPGPLAPGAPLVSVPLSFPVILDHYVAQATLQVPISDYVLRLAPLHTAARQNQRAAALLEDAMRLKVAADGRVLYYSWARARLQTAAAQQALVQARAHLADVRTAAETGAASKADVLRVESQVATAELLATRAASLTDVLEQQLRIVMHDGPARFEIGEDLRADPPADAFADVAAPEEALVAEALDRRLEPQALAASSASARAEARATASLALPRLDAVGNAVYARPNQRFVPQFEEFRGTWDATLQLSWAPTDAWGALAGRKAQLARARRTDAQRAALIDGIRVEIAQARQALREASAVLRSTARGLAAAQESVRVRRLLFQAGRATSVELTDAESDLLRVELDAIAARLDWRIARVRLAHAVGRDVGGGRS